MNNCTYRPFSQMELQAKRGNLYYKLYLSKNAACHSACGHSYLVKRNGKKEKEIIEKGTNDVGNCSVCWKISKMRDRRSREMTGTFIDECMAKFASPLLTIETIDLEADFYIWLYDEDKKY